MQDAVPLCGSQTQAARTRPPKAASLTVGGIHRPSAARAVKSTRVAQRFRTLLLFAGQPFRVFLSFRSLKAVPERSAAIEKARRNFSPGFLCCSSFSTDGQRRRPAGQTTRRAGRQACDFRTRKHRNGSRIFQDTPAKFHSMDMPQSAGLRASRKRTSFERYFQ